MNVILLTVFLGLILVGLAIILFFYTSATSRSSSPEQDSLMPLAEENSGTAENRKRYRENRESSGSAKL